MKLRKTDQGGANFWCPGCQEMHHVNNSWQIDFTTDTISPSILVTSGHYTPQFKPGDDCWCTYNEKHPDRVHFFCSRCHSFVRNGTIEFLADCSHRLAGQTLPLEDAEVHI